MRLGIAQFLFRKSGEEYEPIGTGFFVSYREFTGGNKDDFRNYWPHTYLVTCRHVVEDEIDRNEQLFLRLVGGSDKIVGDTVVSKSFYYELDNNFVFHSDESVDMAAITLKPSDIDRLNSIEYGYGFSNAGIISGEEDTWSKFFITQKGFSDLSIGQDVSYAGLFSFHYGDEFNEPIARFGKICLKPKSMMLDKSTGYKYDLLIESGAYSGNSGSPVFTNLQIRKPNGSIVNRTVLIGILNAVFCQEMYIQHDNKITSQMSISSITNINHLRDLLESKSMSNVRKLHKQDLTLALYHKYKEAGLLSELDTSTNKSSIISV